MISKLLKQKLSIFYFFISVSLCLRYCGIAYAINEDYLAYAKEQAQTAKEIVIPYKAEVDAIVKNVSARQSQPDIQVFKKEITKFTQMQCPMQYQSANPKAAPATPVSTPVLIFISFSMPKESIKSWIAQARKIRAAVYIRGLINNSFKDTTKAVSELVQGQPGGLLIDPSLFKKYSIMQVPAVVVPSVNDFGVVYGNVSLDYALDKINKFMQGSRKNDLSDAIRKLRGIDTKNA